MRRLIAALAAFVAAWLCGTPAAIAGTPAAHVATYAYDGHHQAAVSTHTTTERGPPTVHDWATTHNAVDRWSHGASLRPDAGTTSSTITYDQPTPLVQVAGVPVTTREQVWRADGDLSSLVRGHVAANGGAASVRLGQAGENAVRDAYQIGDKTPFNVLGRDRIADGMTSTTISEVKNVKYQDYTQQLKDYVTYSIDHGLRFDLFVRGGANPTILSPQLEEAVGLGQVT